MAQFITFRVARQEFAMKADRIRGLLPVHEVTHVEAPQLWISGVASLRGKDFPVVDLRGKMGIARGSHGRAPCVIAVDVDGRLLGFTADRVSEIVTIRDRDCRPGFVRVNGRMRPLLNPDRILTEEELMDFWKVTAIP